MSLERKRLTCAIYTRKSSEEGLDQAFNSLDAQREACAAYIESQRHEGWKALDKSYDDGGYSGGSMDRPALRALLSDLEAGKLDVVVVYKVDRLTRSLADFAKIVELLDRHSVSFVSVTQQFNTTSSMGRLTLNVLLSFAQFEREVTGERIRDKIAASKKKGMWMGGSVPLGYDLGDRKLLVNKREAELVRRIFDRYLALGCVRKLRTEFIKSGVKSKVRTSRAGRSSGGVTYSRGALYDILRNRLYIGEIAHRGAIHPGEHQGIVSREIWDRVQANLSENGQSRRLGVNARSPSLLAGLLFDDKGDRLTPLHSTKSGKRYRYYTSQSVIRNGPQSDGMVRIPAHDIESLVTSRVQELLSSPREVLNATATQSASAELQQQLTRTAKGWSLKLSKLPALDVRSFLMRTLSGIVVSEGAIEIRISRSSLRQQLLGDGSTRTSETSPALSTKAPGRDEVYSVQVAARFKRRSGAVRLIVPATNVPTAPRQANDVLIKAIARARRWYEMLVTGKVESLHALAKTTGLHVRYIGRLLGCAYLAPDIVERILEGQQPQHLTLDSLMRGIPAAWTDQRARYLES